MSAFVTEPSWKLQGPLGGWVSPVCLVNTAVKGPSIGTKTYYVGQDFTGVNVVVGRLANWVLSRFFDDTFETSAIVPMMNMRFSVKLWELVLGPSGHWWDYTLNYLSCSEYFCDCEQRVEVKPPGEWIVGQVFPYAPCS